MYVCVCNSSNVQREELSGRVITLLLCKVLLMREHRFKLEEKIQGILIELK